MDHSPSSPRLEEQFEIFNEDNSKVVGLMPRSVVHRDGFLHRAVNVIVLNSQEQVLLQKRASSKDVCPSCWDISCAEHLTPGETYEQAVIRGLAEELSIKIEPLHLRNGALSCMRPAALFKYDDPIKNVKDYEFTECWKFVYDGDWQIDKNEVQEAALFPIAEVARMAAENKELFTPWGLREISYFLRLCRIIR